MPSNFTIQSAQGYDQFMGRWSRKLAPLFISFAAVEEHSRVLDVGCGTGSLTFALSALARPKQIHAIDYSPIFVEALRERHSNPRLEVQQGDACALPFGDGEFDAALSQLVLHFVPDALGAVREMKRVVRPGGIVAAAVWDIQGGMPNIRMVWDTIAVLDKSAARKRAEAYNRPMTRWGEMHAAWTELGLVDVEQTSLTIRMNYNGFQDFWDPIEAGEGPLGAYVTSVDEKARASVRAAVWNAYEAGHGDGPRSFAAVAWACRGRVPPA